MAQRKLDTISTKAAQKELQVLGATADRELSRVQSNVSKIGGNTGSVFAGTSTLPHGFASSKQSTTMAPTLSPIKVPAIDVSGVEKIETASTKALPSVSRLGGGLRTLGTNLGGVASEVAPLTGELGGLTSTLGSVAAGGFAVGGALEVITSAVTTTWAELKRQTKEGVEALTPSASKIVAAFDPSNPRQFGYEVEEIGRKLAMVDATGDLDAWDTINPLDDDSEDRANVKRATIESLTEALNQLSTSQGRMFLEALGPVLTKYKVPAEDAAEITKVLYDELDQRDAIERATNGVEKITNRLDKFGFALEANVGKWSQYGIGLSKAFAPIDAALSAQEALSDGQRTVADAQKKYSDIVEGNTDGLRSAAKAMTEAREDLAKAVAETGPGSKAARDAAGDVRDALRAYRELQVEIGKGPAEGDFFDPRTQDLQDAYDRIVEAQEKLNDINAGNSDQVVSARERLTDAQEKYNEELEKTGPNSKEAADALEAVTDAERELPGLVVNVETAQANLREEINKHPEAIQQSIAKVDEWVKKGLISTAVAKAWKEELILAAAASQNLNIGPAGSEFVGDDGVDREHQGRRPITGPGTRPVVVPEKKNLSDKEAYDIGISAAAAPSYLTDGEIQIDDDGQPWKYRQRDNRWLAQFHAGGMVGPNGGEVHPGEVVLSSPTVQRYGAANLLALNGATPPAPATSDPSAVVELLSRLCAGQEALVNVLRASVQDPNAAVAWLQAIEANTRRQSPGASVADVQSRAAQFV